jgi:aspartyl-tRNA synthetase
LDNNLLCIRKFSPELIFLPIRDSYGTTQLVYKPSKLTDNALQEKLSQLSMESIICVEGVVIQRPKETINKV